MAANSVVSGGFLPKFKLIHAFMYALLTYKNEEDQMKNECERVVTLYNYILSANSNVGGRVWPKIKLIQVFVVVLVARKNEED